MMRSAHSTRPTKIAGLPNFAPHWVTSASVTPRARLQAPQAKTGMCLAMIFSNASLSGPAHRHDRIGGHFAHQRGSFAEEENLHLMAGLRERESVMKRKRS